jgi:hypothetical protein
MLNFDNIKGLYLLVQRKLQSFAFKEISSLLIVEVLVVLLIWISGLASRVQFPVASVTAVSRTREELHCLPEPAYKYKEIRGNGCKMFSLFSFDKTRF